MCKLWPLFFFSVLTSPLLAAETAQTLQSSPISAVSLLQTLFGLILVLGVIVLIAWLLKGTNRFQSSANGKMRVIAGLPLGPRERIVLVQIGNEQLLLGVTSQQINTLHKLSETIDTSQSQAMSSDFANKLKQLMQQKGNQ